MILGMRQKRDVGKIRKVALRAAPPGKTRITIRLDDDVLAWFRAQVRAEGGAGYQKLINLALRDYIAREPLEATLRCVVREELARANDRPSPHSYDYAQSPPAWVADADDASAEYGSSAARGERSRARRRHSEKARSRRS